MEVEGQMKLLLYFDGVEQRSLQRGAFALEDPSENPKLEGSSEQEDRQVDEADMRQFQHFVDEFVSRFEGPVLESAEREILQELAEQFSGQAEVELGSSVIVLLTPSSDTEKCAQTLLTCPSARNCLLEFVESQTQKKIIGGGSPELVLSRTIRPDASLRRRFCIEPVSPSDDVFISVFVVDPLENPTHFARQQQQILVKLRQLAWNIPSSLKFLHVSPQTGLNLCSLFQNENADPSGVHSDESLEFARLVCARLNIEGLRASCDELSLLPTAPLAKHTFCLVTWNKGLHSLARAVVRQALNLVTEAPTQRLLLDPWLLAVSQLFSDDIWNKILFVADLKGINTAVDNHISCCARNATTISDFGFRVCPSQREMAGVSLANIAWSTFLTTMAARPDNTLGQNIARHAKAAEVVAHPRNGREVLVLKRTPELNPWVTGPLMSQALELDLPPVVPDDCLRLFHGTTIEAATSIFTSGIDSQLLVQNADFGAALYATEDFGVAWNYATMKSQGGDCGVLVFDVPKARLGQLACLDLRADGYSGVFKS